jgi:hypothetical protein
VSFDGDDPPYLICTACAERVRTLTLRPREWFRLAARHGPERFELHSDFYDDDGTAWQPSAPVDHPELHPFPSSDECARSLPLALDVAYAKWRLPAELVGLLARAPEETLALLETTTTERPVDDLRCTALKVAARAVCPLAADWVRGHWDPLNRVLLFSLSQASAACLPSGEGCVRYAPR